MACSAEPVLDKALKELARGVVEDLGNNIDSGGRIRQYMTAATGTYPPGGDSHRLDPRRGLVPGYAEAWCADFASWAFKEAGAPLYYRGRGEASVSYLKSWLVDTNRWHEQTAGQPGDVALPGDLVLFDHHIGIVWKVRSDGTLDTIEGNTYDPSGSKAPYDATKTRKGLYQKHRDGLDFAIEGYGRVCEGYGRIW